MTAPQEPQYPSAEPPSPVTPPKKKRHVGRWFLMILGGFVVVMIAVAVSPHATQTTPPQPAATPGQATTVAPVQHAPVGHHVIYQISGTATSASITYNSDGVTSIQQEQGVKVPWTKEFDLAPDQSFAVVQVSGQNGGGGSITCTITVDGKQVKTGTSQGEYAIASCNASIK